MNDTQGMTLAEFQQLLTENNDPATGIMSVDCHNDDCPAEHKLIFTEKGFVLFWSCTPDGTMQAVPLAPAGEPISMALDKEAIEADAKAAAEQAEVDLAFAAIVASIEEE